MLLRTRLPVFSHRIDVEKLERRQLLAAHVVGDLTVYATIQAAVNAAPIGGTVNVDAGVYPELVTVNKALTINGAKSGIDARDGSRGGAGESIVRGLDFGGGVRTSSFLITADGVALDGFTVQDNTSSGTFGAGVVIAPSVSGTHVLDNIIQNNVTGLYLANFNPLAPAIIRHNLFANNNNPGNNSGRGIYTDGGVSGGLLSGVVIDDNTFTGNTGGPSAAPDFQAAVGLEAQTAGKQFNIAITNNVMRDNGKGVLAFNVNGLDIEHNVITGSTDAGSGALRFEGGNSNVNIECNTIVNNPAAGVKISARFVAPDTGITITQNNFAHNAGGGLVVEPGGFNGHLDATNNYWGSSFGPSGDGPGFGDAVLSNGADVAFAPFLAAPSDCAPAIPQTARDAEKDILDDIQHARDAASDKEVTKKLKEVIDKLSDAVDGSLWQDNSHLLKKKGDKFFDLEQDAAHKLSDLLKNKKNLLSSKALIGLLKRLSSATQSIVQTALNDNAGGDSKKLNEALKELSKADDNLADGKFDEAFDHFKKAWKKALEA